MGGNFAEISSKNLGYLNEYIPPRFPLFLKKVRVDKMEKILKDIVNSYDNGISEVRTIIENTYQVLEEYQNDIAQSKEDREKIKAQLREALTNQQHLRRKDFDRMIEKISGGTTNRREEIEKNQHIIREELRGYLDKQKDIAATLRERLARFTDHLKENESNRLRDFKIFLKVLQTQQEKRGEKVRKMLGGFRKELEVYRAEQMLMSQTLRDLLSKGNSLRIRDFKVAISEIQAQQRERQALWQEERKKVRETLAGFRLQKKIISNLKKTKTYQNDLVSIIKEK